VPANSFGFVGLASLHVAETPDYVTTEYGQIQRGIVRARDAPAQCTGWIPDGRFINRDANELGNFATIAYFLVMNDADQSALKQLLSSPGPAELGPARRPGALSKVELERALEAILSHAGLPSNMRDLVQALLLLWHDHLDASHTIAQSIENPDGSLVHAIMHRREPDYWNSKYWWRRVGRHPCFPEIAWRVTELLKAKGQHDLAVKLVPRGEWDAFALVDACETAASLPASAERVQILREVQRIESSVVLEQFLNREGN